MDKKKYKMQIPNSEIEITETPITIPALNPIFKAPFKSRLQA